MLRIGFRRLFRYSPIHFSLNRDQFLHLTVPLAEAIQSRGGDQVRIRDLASVIPDDVHDELGDVSLREVLSLYREQFAVVQARDGSWEVSLRPPVSQELRDELDAIIGAEHFVLLSEVYAQLSPEARNEVKQHKTLRSVCDALGEYYIVSSRGTSVVKRSDAAVEDPDKLDEPVEQDGPLEHGSQSLPLQPPRAVDVAASIPIAPIALDFIPPPPPSAPRVSSTPRVEFDGSAVISIEQLCPFIPSFFAPVEVVLREMPGYTLEHIERLFLQSKAIQVVRLSGTAFIRLHGYYGKFGMEEVINANERYREFEPEPETIKTVFADAFPRPGTWHPLKTVVAKANQEELAKLAYKGPFTLLYFAQLQHLFSFAADNGGAVALNVTSRPLTPAETPCPVAFNEISIATKGVAMMVDELVQGLSPEGRRQLFAHFQSVESFVASHSTTFVINAGVIMQQRDFQRESLKDRSLQEQLEVAYRNQDKKKIRVLRRRIACQANPDNPLLDPQSLARTVAGFLPPDRHVTLKTFLKSLPFEIIDFLPNSYTKFFKNHPDLFSFFEWRFPNNFCVSRAGLPLPDGVLRGTYDELSLVACIVRVLQRKGGSASNSEILLFIPRGARDTLKQQYGSVQGLLSQYPDNFVMVQSNVYGRSDSMTITLTSVPAALYEAVSDDSTSNESWES